MKKRQIFCFVIVLVFLSACGNKTIIDSSSWRTDSSDTVSLTVDTTSVTKEMDNNLDRKRYYWDDQKPLEELLSKAYNLDEIDSFFQLYYTVRDSVLTEKSSKQTLMFYDVDQHFPIEVLRNGMYSVYRIKEGGYYYVFWYPPLWQGIPQREPDAPLQDILAVELTAYIPSCDRQLDFSTARWGSGTLEDVRTIDPYFEFDIKRSSGPTTYSYLNSHEVLEIRYKQSQEIESYSQLVIMEKRIIDRQSAGGKTCFSSILQEDLPKP